MSPTPRLKISLLKATILWLYHMTPHQTTKEIQNLREEQSSKNNSPKS